jgi:hypothetical protein
VPVDQSATIPHTSRHQPVSHRLVHRLLDVSQQTGNASVGLWNFGGAGIEQVIQVGLHVVLQPVEAVALIEEITVSHYALLDDGGVVLVIDEDVTVDRVNGVCLRQRQRFVGYTRLLFEFQGDGGIAAREIHRERTAKRGDAAYLLDELYCQKVRA